MSAKVPLVLTLLCLTATAGAQSIRDRTRPTFDTGTSVTQSQAVDLTLTLTHVASRPIQTWVRTAAEIDKAGKVLTAHISAAEAQFVKAGQRVRAFTPDARSAMYQAKVTRIAPRGSDVTVEATLTGQGRENRIYYVMEIVVDRGEFLSVPNEAIIEEGGKRIVYVQQHPGHYVPQEIHIGVQGELYTEVLHGLTEGAEVVTIGSFFIDAEHKLKSPERREMSNDHKHH